MKLRLAFLIANSTLIACANGPRKTDVPTPTYHEKSVAKSLDAVHAACADVAAGTSDPHQLVPAANACVKAEQWTKVEAYGQALATRAPDAPWGAYYLSLAASARKDSARAQWMIHLALKKAPDQAIFHYELARIYWTLGDEAGVLKEIETAASQSPELAEAHAFVGQIALRRDDLSQAKSQLRLALAATPAMPKALLALAQAEIQSNEYDAAENVLARAIKASPRHGEARLALARVQEIHLKKFDEALRTLREVRQLSAEHKLDGEMPTGLNERIQSLEKTVSQAKREDDSSTRQPSAERK